MPPTTGCFICLEGLDGVGKSTQQHLLAEWLRQRGREVCLCHDPGRTEAGEQIRQILLHSNASISVTSEMLLYMASRAQMVEEIIRPALEQGQVVVCDRFLLSTVVYQGYAGGLSADDVRDVGRVATQGVVPDWTVVLDMEPAAARARRVSAADRIESRGDEYFRKVREGYLAEAQRHPERVTVFDAGQDPQRLHEQIVKEAWRVLAAVSRS